MNRPRRPPFPAQRKKSPARRGPATSATTGPRRRSPLDLVPAVEPRFRVLGTGIDRGSLLTYAQPMEMLVVHGFTNEIEQAFSEFKGRPDEFWQKRPELLEKARKLDEVLAKVHERKSASR